MPLNYRSIDNLSRKRKIDTIKTWRLWKIDIVSSPIRDTIDFIDLYQSGRGNDKTIRVLKVQSKRFPIDYSFFPKISPTVFIGAILRRIWYLDNLDHKCVCRVNKAATRPGPESRKKRRCAKISPLSPNHPDFRYAIRWHTNLAN